MVEIFAIRHGKTQFNLKKKIMGHLDIHLDSKSIDEIKKVGNRLKGINFDIIYSSDLKRASETGCIVRDIINKKMPLKFSKSLREIDYGILSGKHKYSVKREYPQYKKDASFVHPKGESLEQAYKRVVKFINRISPRYNRVLLITHAGCIRAIFSYCSGQKLQENVGMKVANDVILKCTITKKEKRVKILQNTIV